jgi:hypothetical protein
MFYNPCSIAFLQETHLDENIENEIKNKTNFAIYCSNGTSASRGVGIVINKSLIGILTIALYILLFAASNYP